MQIVRFFCAIAWSAAVLAYAADMKTAGSNGLGAPVAGFVVQSNLPPRAISGEGGAGRRRPLQNPVGRPQLRPIIGGVGSGVLGEEIPIPVEITRLAVSPMQNFALAERSTDQSLAVLPVAIDGVGSMQTIAGAFARSERMEFSPAGSAAALYSIAAQRIQVIVGLPGSPYVSQELDVSSVKSPVTSIAVDDDSNVLVGTSDGASGMVYRVSSSGLTPLFPAGIPAAIRFRPRRDSILVADSATNQILLASGISKNPTITAIVGPENGVNGPLEIELLAGDRFALVANTSSKSVLWIDVQEGGVKAFPLTTQPTAIFPMINRAGIAIFTGSPSAFWLAGETASGPTLTFVAQAFQPAVLQVKQ